MPSHGTLDALVLRSSAWSKLLVKHMIAAHEVAATLSKAGVRFILAGAHANNAWARHVRATMDVDILVFTRDHRKAVKAIASTYPSLGVKARDVVTRFFDSKTGEVVLDLMKPKDRLLREVFAKGLVRRIRLEGVETDIPDLEAALAMKFAAMMRPGLKRVDAMQHAVDLARIVGASRRIDLDKLARLADLVYSGGADEVRRLIHAIRKGEPLVF